MEEIQAKDDKNFWQCLPDFKKKCCASAPANGTTHGVPGFSVPYQLNALRVCLEHVARSILSSDPEHFPPSCCKVSAIRQMAPDRCKDKIKN